MDTSKLDIDDVLAAAQNSIFGTGNLGFCTACGEENDGCEPDAENYTCDYCGSNQVFGAEQLLIYMV